MTEQPKPEMPQRYKVMEKSKSAHCCFEATVMDTTKPDGYSDEYGEHFETVCETFSVSYATKISAALNASPDSELLEALEKLWELHLDATGKQKRKSKADIENYYESVERKVRKVIDKHKNGID